VPNNPELHTIKMVYSDLHKELSDNAASFQINFKEKIIQVEELFNSMVNELNQDFDVIKEEMNKVQIDAVRI
jgi:hypothetical protein